MTVGDYIKKLYVKGLSPKNRRKVALRRKQGTDQKPQAMDSPKVSLAHGLIIVLLELGGV